MQKNSGSMSIRSWNNQPLNIPGQNANSFFAGQIIRSVAPSHMRALSLCISSRKNRFVHFVHLRMGFRARAHTEKLVCVT